MAKAKGVVKHNSGGHLELLHHKDLIVDVGLELGQPQELELGILNLFPLSIVATLIYHYTYTLEFPYPIASTLSPSRVSLQ